MPQSNTYPFYGPSDIQRYLSGGMSAQEMHDMEKAALKDPMLADAIDGFRNSDPVLTNQHFNQIKALVSGHQDRPAPVVPLPKAPTPWWRWAIAACSLGLIGASIWWFTQEPQRGSVQAPVAILPKTPHRLPFDMDVPAADTPAHHLSAASPATNPGRQAAKSGPVHTPVATQTMPSAPASEALATQQAAPLTIHESISSTPNGPEIGQNRLGKSQPASLVPDFQKNVTARAKKQAVLVTPPTLVYGTVTDENGRPLPSATIAVAPGKTALSDASGNFAFSAADSSVQVAVSMAGFRQTQATLLPGKTNGITLVKQEQEMNDPVVVGYAKPQKRKAIVGDFRKFKAATEAARNELIYPEDGWAEFYQELSSDLGVDQSKATKTLQIKFTVDENGDPVNFTIVESPNEIITKKAIEFIKKSKWKNFKLDKNALVKIEVN